MLIHIPKTNLSHGQTTSPVADVLLTRDLYINIQIHTYVHVRTYVNLDNEKMAGFCRKEDGLSEGSLCLVIYDSDYAL